MKAGTRLFSLDYLRAFFALGVMSYHFLTFGFGVFTSDTIMGRIGIYGVAIFYILSGLTLYHVYFNKMTPNGPELRDFYIKRVFRIFPLLWLIILITILLNLKIPAIDILLLNVTGLFGIVRWDAYIGTGVWSIGNELVFYLFFPIFIFLSKYFKKSFILFSGVLFSVFLFFAYYKLDPEVGLPVQWSIYINPLNQVFLFLGGFLIGWFFDKYTVSPIVNTGILVIAGLLFVFYPVSGNAINLVSGHTRIVFTIICFAICFSFYKNTYALPGMIDKYVTILGEASYSIYLLHPIIWLSLGKILYKNSIHVSYPVMFISSAVLTLSISYLVFEKYEKFFVRKGSALSKRFITTGVKDVGNMSKG